MAAIRANSKIPLRDGFKEIADIISSFDQPLAHHLEQLGELLYHDVDTGLSQLREGLPRMLRKSKPSDKFNDHAQFFETYKLPDGEKLSTDSVQKLVGLACNLPSGEEAEQNEKDFVCKFSDNPESFWTLLSRPRDPSAISIIRHISESFDEQDYLSPIRRRILLTVLSERVQSESQRIQASGIILKRGQTFKGVANDALLDCLWDATDQSTKKKRERFNRNVRAGQRWTRFEPGVLIGLADHQAWTLWERGMNENEFNAIAGYISSLPACDRWKKLSPLASTLKSSFLSHLTGAGVFNAQSGSGKRKRAGEDREFQVLNPSRQQWRANTRSSDGNETTQDMSLSRDHSQYPITASRPHRVSNTADSMRLLAEVATTADSIPNEYSTPLLNATLMNGINDFDISAGHPAFIDGMNDFDISAGLCAALQPSPVGDTSFAGGMNDFDNPPIHSVLRLPSFSDVPSTGGINVFDTFPNTTSNFETPHESVINSSSLTHGVNNFDISAGQEDVSSPTGFARFQPAIEISQRQYLVGA